MAKEYYYRLAVEAVGAVHATGLTAGAQVDPTCHRHLVLGSRDERLRHFKCTNVQYRSMSFRRSYRQTIIDGYNFSIFSSILSVMS